MSEERKEQKTRGGNPTVQIQIVAAMKEGGRRDALWTPTDIMAATGLERRPCENALYNAWRKDRICRHKTKSDDDQYRYALSMKDEYQDKYVQKEKKGRASPRRKVQVMTVKEMRTMFAQIQNMIAQMEDSLLNSMEELEKDKKTLAKMQEMMNR